MAKNNAVAQNIYNTLDMITGIVVERGWEHLDRYSNTCKADFNMLLKMLQKLDPDLYIRMEKELVRYGMMEKK